jgi:osmoprotectant transport system permease protein
MKIVSLILWGILITPTALSAADDLTVKIASKLHTEGVILAELMTHLVNHTGVKAIHRRELGGTHVIWKALLKGEIDLCAKYTSGLTQLKWCINFGRFLSLK